MHCRILFALQCLRTSPQNNFRMFINGHLVWPVEETESDKDDNRWHEFQAMLSGCNTDRNSENLYSADLVLKCLATILHSEPLLHQIRTLQQRDEIDIEVGVFMSCDTLVALLNVFAVKIWLD